MPLRTQGRFVVGRSGERVKLACVNWYGFHSGTFVVGGLEARPLADIVARIVELGFNCVRLPYSTEGQVLNPVIQAAFVKANPEFAGKRFYDVLDAVVASLTDAGLMVIPNNQNHKAGWCCYYLQDEGLWYVDGYPPSMWVESLVNITRRYRHIPLVSAIDLRNEVHDYGSTVLTWGTGTNRTDWAAAATEAGNAVLAANPDVLVVVNGLCFGMDIRPARDYPVKLSVPNRVVYEAHNYLEFNFFSLFSEVVLAWYNVRLISGLVFGACGLSVLASVCTWRLLGKPRPACRAFVGTCSWWLFAYSLLTVGMCLASDWQLRKLPACGYWAERDVTPVTSAFVVVSALSLVCGLWATCLHRFAAACRRRLGPGRPFKRLLCCGDEPPSRSASTPRVHAGTHGASTNGDGEGAPELHSATESSDDDREDGDDAHSPNLAPLCAPGFASCALARAHWKARIFKKNAAGISPGADEESPELPASPEWDLGLCLGLQCCLLSSTLMLLMLLLFAFAVIAPSYSLLSWHLNNQWGFLLEEGHDYTAPVWLGEFGSPVPGHYWNNLVQYINEYDMDFAYWALNGRKWTTAFIDPMRGGIWVDTPPHWTEDKFGILEGDYKTVRYAWMMLDLRALQASPANWRPSRPYCDRRVLGPACGG